MELFCSGKGYRKSSLHSTELLGKYGDTLFLHFSSESNGQYLKLQVALGISPNEEMFQVSQEQTFIEKLPQTCQHFL